MKSHLSNAYAFGVGVALAMDITLKQVQALEDKYNMLGLRIENAKKREGYARGSGAVGELQAKKGRAFSEWQKAKKELEQSNSASE